MLLAALLLLLIQTSPIQTCDAVSDRVCQQFMAHLERASTEDPDLTWQASLRYVANQDEMARWFSQTSASGRRDFLHKFWATRGASEAVSPQDRYAEHVRRLEIAHEWYARRNTTRMPGGFGVPTWYKRALIVLKPEGRQAAKYIVDLDDRGLVYVRYGEPDVVERCKGSWAGARLSARAEYEAAEVWIYPRIGNKPPQISLFATRGRASEFQIVTTLAQTQCDQSALGQMARLKHRLSLYDPRFNKSTMHDMYSARGFDGAITEFLRGGGWDVSAMNAEDIQLESREAQERLAEEMERLQIDRFNARYQAQMTAVYEALLFRSDVDTTKAEVTLSAATAVSQLGKTSSSDASKAFRITWTATDSAHNPILFADTLFEFAVAEAAPNTLATLHAARTFGPGVYNNVVRVEGGAAALRSIAPAGGTKGLSRPTYAGAGAVDHKELRVPSFIGEPALSSIAVGIARPGQGWRRYGRPIGLLPTHVLQANQPAALYYELYGATEGSGVETQIAISRENASRPEITLKFSEVAEFETSTSVVSAARALDLSKLSSGTYDITVSIKTAERTVERKTVLIIPKT